MNKPVEGTTPIWIAARELLHERVDDFFRRRDKVLNTFDADDIHDLRVASRRLREGLALFAPCYPAENMVLLVKRLKKVTRLLGEIRNTDEAIMFFSALPDQLEDSCRCSLEYLVLQFQKNRKKERKKLKAGLRELVPKSLSNKFRQVINSPVLLNPAGNSVDPLGLLTDFAGRALDDRLSAVLKLIPDASKAGEIEAQHKLRIAVKHYRYRIEILDFLVWAQYEELHGAVKGYQEVLGKMHDLDVFAGVIRKAVFPSLVEKSVLGAIAVKREELFEKFSKMLGIKPLELIGEQLRSSMS